MERCFHVLIADSNEAFCEELAQRLTGAEGFAVAGIATDGQRAVELLRTCRPELMVLDLMLPKLDGVSVLKAAGELERRPVSVVLSPFVTDYVARRR